MFFSSCNYLSALLSKSQSTTYTPTPIHLSIYTPTPIYVQGPMDATMKILKREGVVALFDGVGARMLWLTPRLSITVSLYEICSGELKIKYLNKSE